MHRKFGEKSPVQQEHFGRQNQRTGKSPAYKNIRRTLQFVFSYNSSFLSLQSRSSFHSDISEHVFNYACSYSYNHLIMVLLPLGRQEQNGDHERKELRRHVRPPDTVQFQQQRQDQYCRQLKDKGSQKRYSRRHAAVACPPPKRSRWTPSQRRRCRRLSGWGRTPAWSLSA